MADANYEAEQLARILEQVNRELAEFGEVSQETNRKLYDANMKAKYGIDNATKGFNAAGQAVGALGKAAAATAGALYNNEKGAKAFGSALDGLAEAATLAGTALTLLIPGGIIMKGVVAGLTMAAGAALKYAKMAGEQSDALYKGFQDISKSGGAASDGLSGLFGDIQKLGLGFQDLGEYTKLVANSSRELAMFGGSVSKGRREFASVGASLNQYRDRLMNMGLSQTEINEGLMNYLRLQTRVGQTQNRTTEQLAESARKYLVEQDALTKLTGMTRKEQEDAREEVLSQERFAAKAAELRARGEGAKADEMVATYAMLRKYNKDAAQGFADLSTGMITTEAAQKSYFATQGDGMRVAQKVAAGQMTAVEATQRLARVYGQTAESLRPLALMGGFEDVAGSFTGAVELGILGQNDLNEQYKKIKEDQAKQGVKDGKAADSALDSQTRMRIAQQNSMLALQKMVNNGVGPVTDAMEGLANASERVTMALTKIADFFGLSKGPTAAETKAQAAVDAQKREVLDLEWKVINAKNEREKELAKQELKAAKSKLLSAEADRKYAQDRATGAGAGMGGAELRADGSIISPGDEDYVSPEARAQRGATQGVSKGATADQLSGLGLRIKEGGDVQSAGEKISPKLIELAKQIQSAVPGFKYFSGFNDEYHQGTTSKHAEGMALDFTLEDTPSVEQGKQIIDAIKKLGASSVIDEYNFPSSRATAGHIHVEIPKFAEGGIAQGPKSGYPAELHGTEAVIPLKNGAVPVSLDMRNAMGPQGIGPTFAGYNEYKGYNMGPMTTDLSAIKDIAAKIGAYDAATNMITDPETWKQIVGSGIAMNYDLGLAEIGTKLVPGIGAEIGDRIKELKDAGGIDLKDALAQVTQEFKTAMIDAIQTAGNGNSALAGEQLAALTQLVREQQSSNTLQEKLLRASAN